MSVGFDYDNTSARPPGDGLPGGAVVANLPNPHREAGRLEELLRRREREGRLVVADMRARGPRSWRGNLAVVHDLRGAQSP